MFHDERFLIVTLFLQFLAWLAPSQPGLGFRGKVIWSLSHAVLLKPLLSLRHVLERETLGDNAVHMPFYASTR